MITDAAPTNEFRPLSEGQALLAAIDALAPSSPTACEGWTAHHIAAHLAAGAKEIADLIDESLSGLPGRPTRGFEEREAPMRALPHDELRDRLVAENVRKLKAWASLAERAHDPAIAFTGTLVSVVEFETHSRSEAAIHRWDLVGTDETSSLLLAQPELTDHAVKVLNRMSILDESARALGARAQRAGGNPLRIVFRSPDRHDVVFLASNDDARIEVVGEETDADLVLTTDPGNRLLALWGRRPSSGSIAVEGDPRLARVLGSVLWPHAQPWPRSG
jgi:uncharacterized protein (TIGR03083 family)